MQKRYINSGVTLQQISLLNKLSKSEYMLPLEIADYLHCDRPTASVVIKNLEKKKFISRQKDENNAKYHRIYISQKGKEFFQDINSLVPTLTISPFDILTPEENEQFFLLLNKCCSRMKDILCTNCKEDNNESNARNNP